MQKPPAPPWQHSETGTAPRYTKDPQANSCGSFQKYSIPFVENFENVHKGVLVRVLRQGLQPGALLLGGPGRSLLPAAEGGKVEERELFFEHQGSCAVIRGSWKLVRADKRSPWQLFDLEADPFETADLKEREPQRAADLEASWNRWAETHNVLPLEDKKWTQRINYYKQLNPDQDGID